MVIVWRVVESCNLACRFCGYSRDLPGPRLSADVREVKAFGQVLEDVQRLTGRSILVSWLGGEPLAWSPLGDLSRYYHETCGLRLGVTTNGLPLAAAPVRETLIRHFEQVTLSIDGLQPFHDAVRGSPGAFAKLGQFVQALRTQGAGRRLLLRVNTVLMRGNIGQFAAFCEEMARWGFDELSFNQLGGNERPEFFASNHLLVPQVHRFVEELPALKKTMAQRGLTICGSQAYLDRIEATTAHRAIPVADCRPATELLFIDSVGRISPCSFTTGDYGVALAEVTTPEAFLRLPERFQHLRLRRAAACEDCHATHMFAKFTRPSFSIGHQ